MKKLIKDEIILAVISFITIVVLLIVPFINQKINITNYFDDPKNNEEQYLENIANIYDVEINTIHIYNINNKYQNIKISKENEIISFVINKNTKNRVESKILFKNESIEDINKLINQEVFIKYPKFIAEELIKDTTTTQYEFNNDGIIIYFDDFITNPLYKKTTYITLTCPQIKEYIKYTCVNENITSNPNTPILDKNKKTIAITFDDGPHKYTKPILETLQENHMNATFFQVGTNMLGKDNIIKQILEQGNEIGSHSYSHKSLTSIKKDALEKEINYFNNIYYGITSNNTSLLRPPYGNINNDIQSKLNYSFILWSVDPEDWKYKDAQKIAENVLSEVEDGDIVLLHDIHLTTSEALKIILPELYVRDYQVVTVSKLAELKNYSLEKNKIYRNFK